MQWPSPPYGVYAEFIMTVLATMALLQYVGVSGSAGEFGLAFLVGTGCMLPAATYLLTFMFENTARIPQWAKMVTDRPLRTLTDLLRYPTPE